MPATAFASQVCACEDSRPRLSVERRSTGFDGNRGSMDSHRALGSMTAEGGFPHIR